MKSYIDKCYLDVCQEATYMYCNKLGYGSILQNWIPMQNIIQIAVQVCRSAEQGMSDWNSKTSW